MGIVQQTVAVNNGGASADVIFSSTPTAGNFLLFFVASRGTFTVTPPAGLVTGPSSAFGAGAQGGYYSRVVQSGDGTTWTFGVSGDFMNIVAYELSGVNTTAPIDGSPVFSADTNAPTMNDPGYTPTSSSNGGLAFSFITSDDAGALSFTAQSPWATATQAGPGSTGYHNGWVSTTTSFTAGVLLGSNWNTGAGSNNWAGIVMVVNPPASPGTGMPPLISLHDIFSFADSTKWLGTGNASCNIVSGQLVITPTGSYPGYYSSGSYNLTGKGVLVQVISAPTNPSAPGSSEGIFGLDANGTGDGWQFSVQADNDIVAVEIVSGVTTLGPSVAWPGPVWLRMYESGGTAYWDYSRDGAKWVNLWTKTWAVSSITAMFPYLQGGYYAGTPSGTATYDNFNTPFLPTFGLKF
ncbi:MAG: hypothetical protein WDN27_04300 [Candidatus Saccharibacteria bacterium]